METVFGESLIQFKQTTAEEAEEYATKMADARKEGVEYPANPSHVVCKTTEIARTQFVAVLFTASYGKPCTDFMAPFAEFVATLNKDSQRMHVVVVNCDKREKDFNECISKLPKSFYAVPFKC